MPSRSLRCSRRREKVLEVVMTFRAVVILFLISSSLIPAACSEQVDPVQAVHIVRIPPFYDPGSTAGENQCKFATWWHPPDEKDFDVEAACKGAGLPHDGVPLEIELRQDGSLFLNNSKPAGHLTNTSVLSRELSEIFRIREEMGVYRVGSTEIEKSVGIDVPLTAKYGDLVKVLEAVEASGADQILLILDGHLPKQTIDLPPDAR